MCLAYIVVSVTTEAASYSAQRASLRTQLGTRASSDAAILAAGSVGNMTGVHGPKTLQIFVSSVMSRTQGLSYAAVIVNDTIRGSTKASEIGKPKNIPLPDTAKAKTLSNGDVEGLAPIATASPGAVFGVAEVILSGSSIESDLRRSIILETLVRGLGLLLFILLSLVISRYILGPLSTLARVARAIRRGYLSARVPASGRTELTTVAEAFNDMASSLEERIRHFTFLANAAAMLPNTFRDKGDVTPILRDFCDQIGASGACLYPRGEAEEEEEPMVCQVNAEEDGWLAASRCLAERVQDPSTVQEEGYRLMAVPVLGDAVFVTARAGERPFSQEEQQVITNFAYQVGVAADNARLFDAQQEALKVKDQFLSIVSHELRTPLTTIKGYAQMLGRKLDGDDEGQRFANTIDAQTGRLSRLVDDLLDVTRFTRGQFELTRERMNIVPVLRDVVQRFRLVAPRHSFEFELDPGPAEGYWDHDRLEQVMNNLVSNAIKYSPDGGTITVGTRHDNGTIVVAVRDQGIGIPEEDQEHLFERFFRGKAEKADIKGLGLGLYVTRRIVEAHGGVIAVSSKPDEGSEFSFSLPLLPQPAAQREAQRSLP
jgi:two-component system sensor histidine kinase VicK